MVERKKSARNKGKMDWRQLAGVHPPMPNNEHLPDTLVKFLNSVKGDSLRVVSEAIPRLKVNPRRFVLPPGATHGLTRMIIDFLIELETWGALGRLRLCEGCNVRWFFAQHLNYRFCSDSCRRKFYQSSPATLEATKLRMRRYRADVKKKKEAEAKARAEAKSAAESRARARRLV